MKKRLKIGMGFTQDNNFNDLYFTKAQATKACKQYKKSIEQGFKRGGVVNYKFKHFEVIEKDSYFTCSMA